MPDEERQDRLEDPVEETDETEEDAIPLEPEDDTPSDEVAELELPFEEELTQPRDERVSPLILSAAVVGLLVGLFVWGSLAMSVMSSTGDVIDDISADSEGALESEVADLKLDCSEFGADRSLTAELEAIYQSQCVTPDAEAEATQAPEASEVNRADCDAIRGTDYRSAEERQWFLDNCIER